MCEGSPIGSEQCQSHGKRGARAATEPGLGGARSIAEFLRVQGHSQGKRGARADAEPGWGGTSSRVGPRVGSSQSIRGASAEA